MVIGITIFSSVILLSNHHFNVLFLIVIANVNLFAVLAHDKRIIQGHQDLVNDDDYITWFNLTFIAVYFLTITIVFGSHICNTVHHGHHFVLGLESYFTNEWTGIYLAQKITGILYTSVF